MTLATSAYIEDSRWEGPDLRVKVPGPDNYENSLLIEGVQVLGFLSSFNITKDNSSSLAGHSVYALYREFVLIEVGKRG